MNYGGFGAFGLKDTLASCKLTYETTEGMVRSHVDYALGGYSSASLSFRVHFVEVLFAWLLYGLARA